MKPLPPVNTWNPPLCGEMDLRIDRNYLWHYNGSPVRRYSLLKLFASIMRKDADGVHYLLTPVEKWAIAVEDTPFCIVDFARRDGYWVFVSNMEDEVVLDEAHPFRHDELPAPRIVVRDNLEARLTRNVFYRIVDVAVPRVEDSVERLVLESGGKQYVLGEC